MAIEGFFSTIRPALPHLQSLVGPVVEQHPSVVQQLKPFVGGVTVLSHPPVGTVGLEVVVTEIVGFRAEIVGPDLSGGVDPPRVVAVRGVDDLRLPGLASLERVLLVDAAFVDLRVPAPAVCRPRFSARNGGGGGITDSRLPDTLFDFLRI